MNTSMRTTSTTAVVSLVLGVLCWSVFPFAGAIIAIVCGHVARADIRRASPGSVEGDGMAVAGMILGYAQLALLALGVLVLFGLLGGLAFFGYWHWH